MGRWGSIGGGESGKIGAGNGFVLENSEKMAHNNTVIGL